MPAFGTMSVRGMLDDMKDICGQLLLKVSFYGAPSSSSTNVFICLVGTVGRFIWMNLPRLLTFPKSFGPNGVIDPSTDFTRVALDTIAYCTMSYRYD